VDTRVTLVLGGARSGKSRYAEELTTAFPPPWTYIATAEAFDQEMTERIAEHKTRRGSGWQTVDAPRDLPNAILANPATTPILADCLTLWLSNLMLADQDIEAATQKLDDALAARRAPTFLVANEVGFGIVPENALARKFRDLQGRLNQRIAARADRVVLVVAGIPLVIKETP
jgi:adenosylcobinamide kinase/adenosylcobinamide-phosphate guanylyltransferase